MAGLHAVSRPSDVHGTCPSRHVYVRCAFVCAGNHDPARVASGSKRGGMPGVVASRGADRRVKELGKRVRRAVERLLQSRASLIGSVWNDHRASDLYAAACQFVMRLVVMNFAEARGRLPGSNHHSYGLRSLLDQLDTHTPARRRTQHIAWPQLLARFRRLHQGPPHLVAVDSADLYAPGHRDGTPVQRALAVLETCTEPPDDQVVHHILVLLTQTTQRIREGTVWRTVTAPVDFTALASESIGIVYEGLLDYELHRVGEQPVALVNFGDQLALPLDRLEAMDDTSLKSLIQRAKVTSKTPATVRGDDNATLALSDAVRAGINEDTSSGMWTKARSRAIAWARRVVEVIGVTQGTCRDVHAQAQADALAARLVADVKLPGELYLVRWGGTRKGAGTFYTHPQLTIPTVRRTLEPLLYEQGEAGRIIRPPEALLALKVCDPAMGSGSFLLATVRALTAAVCKSMYTHGRITQVDGHTRIDCNILPEGARTVPTRDETRVEAVIRRAVVEHCIYGVDLDPLAVLLARAALWIETDANQLPLTFLDHKLRCGDALVGTWFDRFQDYPLLCFERQSPDWTSKEEQWRLPHHPWRLWHAALKKRSTEAIAQQVSRLEAEVPEDHETSDALRTAVTQVGLLYRDLCRVPANRPDERARMWRTGIATTTTLSRVREAFDTWCALWFWPLDQLDVMPLPNEFCAPGDAARQIVTTLRTQKGFFHWELEFPDVFAAQEAGFDAIVGNPPWEIQKPNSREFFSNHDPLYRAYGKQDALRAQRGMFAARRDIEMDWLEYHGGFKDFGNFVKHAAEPFGDARVAGHNGGDVRLARGKRGTALHRSWRRKRARVRGYSDPEHPFRHQGSADLNTYKMFFEQAHALVRTGGHIGLIVPSGLYTDQGTGPLRHLLLKRCRWRWLYGFENRDKLFDIHRSFKFGVVIATKGGTTETVQAAFMRHDLSDWAHQRGVVAYPAQHIESFSPTSRSVLEIRSQQDLEIMTKIYANGISLGNTGTSGWGVEYSSEFHMTNDSKHFLSREKAQRQGYKPRHCGRWVNQAGDVLLPLVQGVMLGPLEFNRVAYVGGRGLRAKWERLEHTSEHIRPQFLMREDKASEKLRSKSPRVGFRPIARTTDRRTMIPSLIPGWPAGNSVGILHSNIKGAAIVLAGLLGSYTFDWQLRTRQSGSNVNWFLLAESVVVPPSRSQIIGNIVAPLFAQRWFAPEITRFGRRKPAATPHERLRLRCMLDAIVAELYGLDRDDFAWVLKDCDHPTSRLSEQSFCRQLDAKGFWRVDRTEDPELRHGVLSLAAFDDLMIAIAAADTREAGLQAFCDQHAGDGWMLPETLCIADLGLTRTVDGGNYDERARNPQPVRRRMGPRFVA